MLDFREQLQFFRDFLNFGFGHKFWSKAISYTVVFRQSKTALFDWTFFRLDSSAPFYRQSS